MMKKIFLLLSLLIWTGLYAQNANSTKFSYRYGENSTKKTTLNPEREPISSAISKENPLNIREEKENNRIEIFRNGLPDDERQNDANLLLERALTLRLDSIISYLPNGNKHNGQFITYDAQYHMTRLHNCNWIANAWVTVEDHIYAFDENGNTILYHLKVPAWGEESRYVYSYNDLNQCTTRVFSILIESDWMNLGREEYAYDANGNMTEVIISNDDGAGGWENSSREVAVYDSQGRQTLWESYSWTGTSWMGDVQEVYTYDDLDHQTSQIISFWDGSAWGPDMKYEHIFDGNNIITQLIAFWNGTDWNGRPTDYIFTGKTEYTYDAQNRETEQIYYEIKDAATGIWVEEGAMYTVWSDLPEGGTQSIRNSFDDDILVGQTFQTLTIRYNEMGLRTYEDEVHHGHNSHTLETFLYDDNGNELEYKFWEYNSATGTTMIPLLHQQFEYNNLNKPTLQINYLGGNNGPEDWLIVSKFEYQYEDIYRTRNLMFSANESLTGFIPNWGWGIDFDSNTPASQIIQLYTAEYFQDNHYDYKITHTYDYQSSGENWYIIDFVRYYNTMCPVEISNTEISFNNTCTATITWDVAGANSDQIYNIYRDGELIDEVTDVNSYVDNNFTPLENHVWCIAASCGDGIESISSCIEDICSPSFTITASAGTGGTISPDGVNTVIYGNDLQFILTPNTGYAIDQVLIDGTNNTTAIESGTYTFTNVMADHTIEVTFKLSEYTISASAGAGGSITPSGEVGATHGENKTFTITPNTGYYISSVLVDGINNPAAVTNGSYTFHNISADHTISATFAIYTYTITASAGTGGTISPEGTVTVNHGENRTFLFTPDATYEISRVLIDGVNNPTAVEQGNYPFTNISDNHTIAVEFELKSYTITASAGTGGSITPNGDVDALHGESKSFTIAAQYGYNISRVLIDGVNSVEAVNSGSHTFENITADHTIAAEFELITYVITATAGEGGAISPSGDVSVGHGQSQDYTITPQTNYIIKEVLVDGTSYGAIAVFTFSNVTTTHTIEARFQQISGITINPIVSFNVYPIPTTGIINIEISDNANLSGIDKTIYIYDIHGRQVYQTLETSFDISHLSSGIYMLKAFETTVKIVKQ